MWIGIVVMLIGFVFMALDICIYTRAAQGCRPRDPLLVVRLGKRMPKVPIGVVEITLWMMVLAIDRLLNRLVGIGTLISTFKAGTIM